MKITSGTVDASLNAIEASHTFISLSKNVELKSYKVFFPVVEDEVRPHLVAPYYVVRQCDKDVMGISSVVYVPGKDYDPTSDRMIDLSPLKPYATIAKVLYNAAEAAALEECRARYEYEASKTPGGVIDEVGLKAKQAEIRKEYEGDPDAQGSDKYATKKRIIGPLSQAMCTIGLRVEMTSGGEPIWSTATPVAVNLGKERGNVLNNALKPGGSYVKGSHWLEMDYNITGSDLKEAKKHAALVPVNTRTAIMNDERLWNNEERKTAFGKIRETPDLESMSDEQAQAEFDSYVQYVRSKNYACTPICSTAEAVRKFQFGVASESFTPIRRAIDTSNDLVRENAKMFLESNIFDADADIQRALMTLANESGAKDETNAAVEEEASVVKTAAILNESTSQKLGNSNAALDAVLAAVAETGSSISDELTELD